MSQLEDLQAQIQVVTGKVSEVGDLLTDYAIDIKAAIDALKAQIAAGQDLRPAITSLEALAEKLSPIAESLKALDTDAETISGQPTPPPTV